LWTFVHSPGDYVLSTMLSVWNDSENLHGSVPAWRLFLCYACFFALCSWQFRSQKFLFRHSLREKAPSSLIRNKFTVGVSRYQNKPMARMAQHI
jgi:hypothetical protein